MQAKRPDPLTSAAIAVVDVYRNLISPNMLHSCRFIPSCSTYARETLQCYGMLAGGWRALGRLLRCHPFSRGGVDPA